MITIYHNPRCSKSRESLELLEKTGKEYSVVKYLDTPLTKIEIKDLLQKLGIKPLELVRQNEDIWKEHFAAKKLTSVQIINALVKYPQLIERPIIVNGDKAVIARPAEKAKEIF